MQKSDVRIDPRDDFTVELQHQAQHPMRSWMLGTKVDGEIAKLCLGHR
jgi:hypothetical protein